MVESVLVGSGMLGFARRRMRGRALILAYHNVVPRGEHAAGERTLHLPQEAFALQLDLLVETHDVVPLDTLLGGTADEPASGRPRVAITFDDGYRGAMTVGVDELARRNLPATAFIAPAFVGGGTFWWDALAPDTGFTNAQREAALTEQGGLDDAVRRRAAEHGLRLREVPLHAQVAGEVELRAALKHPGLTLGSHSWSHPNLARLDEPALVPELRRPLEWLRQRFGRVTDVIAYPYGLSSFVVERAAAAAGYRAGLLVAGGWLTGRDDRLRLPRFNVPAGLSANGFRLRAAGLLTR